ncbi:hypothetical protein LXL04_011430 [Taraxacum kok-saghyz]
MIKHCGGPAVVRRWCISGPMCRWVQVVHRRWSGGGPVVGAGGGPVGAGGGPVVSKITKMPLELIKAPQSRSFENSYIPENPRTLKPLTFSKNRLRGAKNSSNISPVAKNFFRKNDFFFSKTLHMCKLFLCVYVHSFLFCFKTVQKHEIFLKFFYRSLYNTYLKRFVKKNLKKNAKKKSCTYAKKIKKSCTYAKVKKKYRFFGNFFQQIVMIKNVLEGSEVGFLKRITVWEIYEIGGVLGFSVTADCTRVVWNPHGSCAIHMGRSYVSVYNHAFAFPELVAIPATKMGNGGGGGGVIINGNPGNIRVCSGPDFLPVNPSKVNNLYIPRKYKMLTKQCNWFRLKSSFLRFILANLSKPEQPARLSRFGQFRGQTSQNIDTKDRPHDTLTTVKI